MLNDSFRLWATAFTLTVIPFTPLISIEYKAFIFLSFCIFNFSSKIKIRSFDKFYLLFFIYVIVQLIRDLLNTSLSGQNSYVGILFVLSFLFATSCYLSSCGVERILYYCEKIIYVGALLSLLGVPIYLFFPDLIYSLPEYHNREFVHKTALFTNFLIINAGPVARNTGFASEPGMWQYLLNVGVLLHFFLTGTSYSFRRVIVYLISVITTLSTAGLATFFVILIISINKLRKRHKVFLFSILLVSTPMLWSLVSYHLQYKLNPDVAGFQGRFLPALNILSNYVSMFGFGNVFYDNHVLSSNLGSYDSYTQILVRFGLFGLFLYGFMLIFLRPNSLWLRIPIILTSFSQAIWFYPLTVFLIIVSLSKVKRNERKE